MAQISALRTSIPRQLEISRQFQTQDMSASEKQNLRDRVFGADLEAELRSILGRTIESLDFIEVTWGRFQEFVQRLSEPGERGLGVLSGSPIEKSELSLQLRLEGK